MFIFQTFDFQICTEYTGKMKPTIIRVGLDEIKVETTDNPGTTATAPPTTTSTITTPPTTTAPTTTPKTTASTTPAPKGFQLEMFLLLRSSDSTWTLIVIVFLVLLMFALKRRSSNILRVNNYTHDPQLRTYNQY